MIGFFPSLAALAAVALLVFAGGTPAPESSFGSTAVVQLEADAPQPAVAERETPQDADPLVVGPPPESLIVLTSGGELFTEPKASEPPPGLLPVKFTQPPAKKAAPAATGQWVTRYAGFRGRRSYTEWVPAGSGTSNGNCANGSCSSGAIANGSLPGYFGYGGCRSCR